MNRILLYGATGYMGRLIAEAACDRERDRTVPLILAGRDKDRLAALAHELDLPYRSLVLETPSARAERLKRRDRRPARTNADLDAALSDVAVVINAAGPFAATAECLARACMRTQTHYMDISGEYATFALLDGLDDLARENGVSLRPGVGFTPLASEMLAGMALVAAHRHGLREPHVARVALSRLPAVSRGSARTMLESVRDGILVRENGRMTVTPIGRLVRACQFGADDEFGRDELRLCTALTLADGYTASRTLPRLWRELSGGASAQPHVPNVETYVEASGIERFAYELGGVAALALRTKPAKQYLDKLLSALPEGPPTQLRHLHQQVVVEIEDRYRRSVHARLSTVNSYEFTAAAVLAIARAAAAEPSRLPLGLLTPAQGLGNPGEFLGRVCELKMSFHGLRANSLDMKDWNESHGPTYGKVA